MISTKCPKCGKVFNLDQKHAGRHAKCVCGEIFIITLTHTDLLICPNRLPENEDVIIAKGNSSVIIIALAFVLVSLFVASTIYINFNKSKDINLPTKASQEERLSSEIRNIAKEQEREDRKVVEEQRGLKEKKPYIDLTWTKVPDYFRGHDIQAIYAVFSKIEEKVGMSKDRFETEEQFKNRVQKSLPVFLSGEISTNSLFAFIPSMGNLSYYYDAEQQEYQFKIPLTRKIIKTAHLESPDYTAQNAFGVKINVSNMRWINYILEFNGDALFSEVPVTLKMSPEKAKLWSDHIVLFYIV